MKHNLFTAAVFTVLTALFGLAANDWELPWRRRPARVEDPKLARGGTFTTREREPAAGECPNTLVRVTLAPDAARRAGIEFYTVDLRDVAETLRANAETRHMPSAYARVAARIPGVIREVKALLGQEVEAGASLAVVESPEFGQAKSDYLQALGLAELRQKTYDQEKELFEKKITSGRDLMAAQTSLAETNLDVQKAAAKLAALGLSPDQVKAVADTHDTSTLMNVPAPFKGVVLEASAVVGETATPEKPIFAVADVARLWLTIDASEADLQRIEPGQKVVFRVDGLVGKRFNGKVLTVGGEVDDRTRTVKVVAEVKNVQGLLRANMFGRAEIVVKPAEQKLLVPKEAVQSDGDCSLVFVSPVLDVFQARKIEVGAVYDGGYEVVGGLAEGETVVTTGSFLLKTEVMRGEMGAG